MLYKMGLSYNFKFSFIVRKLVNYYTLCIRWDSILFMSLIEI